VETVVGLNALLRRAREQSLPPLRLAEQAGSGQCQATGSVSSLDPQSPSVAIIVTSKYVVGTSSVGAKVGLMSRLPADEPRPALLGIGELARRSGKPRSALRYYEDIGLLPQVLRVDGQRRYPVDTLRTLVLIEIAQRAGLRLDEMRPLLDVSPTQRLAVDRLREVAQRKLPAVEAQLERTSRARDWLTAAALCYCPSLDDCGLFDRDTADCGLTP
jgi:MerR family redox-sensitive transcriptional activator SoxR